MMIYAKLAKIAFPLALIVFALAYVYDKGRDAEQLKRLQKQIEAKELLHEEEVKRLEEQVQMLATYERLQDEAVKDVDSSKPSISVNSVHRLNQLR